MRTDLRSSAGRSWIRLLIAMSLLAVLGGTKMLATLATDYSFTSSAGVYTPITGTMLINGSATTDAGGTFNDTISAGPVNIGFTFAFGCSSYNTFTVSGNGSVYLGNYRSGNPNNNLAGAPGYPVLAPWWDHQHYYNGGGAAAGCTFNPNIGVQYTVTGSAPNRVLIIEFDSQVDDANGSLWWSGCGNTMNHYQMALYETSNKVEFRYGVMWISSGQPTAGTIGIAASGSDFISLTPSGATATTSSAVSNNNIAQHLTPTNNGVVYALTPCIFTATGNPPLATTGMASGDSILNTQSVIFGNEASYTPFTLSLAAGSCASRNYTISITGANATDYRFTATGNQIVAGALSAGSSISYVMAFRPGALGRRPATLTITDNTSGCARNYVLGATGSPRITLTGNIAQGGTATMSCGRDTLLGNQYAIRGVPTNFQPFTANDIASMGLKGSANVTYTITGGLGQYTINPPAATISDGGTNTPTITFTPLLTSQGSQSAQLTVAADGQSCSFVLYALAAFPSLDFVNAGTKLDSASTLFVNTYACVGEQGISIPIDLVNTNFLADTIFSAKVYETDTLFAQGSPRYPLRHSQFGTLVPSKDYILSLTANVAPIQKNTIPTYPIVIPPLQTTRVYLTFVSQRLNKRFARLFVRTNALNFAGPDTNGAIQQGLLRVDVFGRGIGGMLSDNAGGGLPKPIAFPVTHVGDSADMPVNLFNTGTCNLRVSLRRFAIDVGDVSEFSIVNMPVGTVDPATGDLMLAPGTSATATIRFKPSQVDSRRASLRIQTSDSSIAVPGITERGTYYLDVYGSGKQDLYAQGADLGTALIGGDASEHTHGVVHMQNTQNGPVVIGKFVIAGPDAGEFNEDPLHAWPKGPKTIVIQGGKVIDLGIEFAPKAGGTPGPRNAALLILLANGDTLTAPLHGIAGTRTIQVAPSNLTFGPITVGKEFRQHFTIKSTGTMSLKLSSINLPPGTDFSIAPLARMDLVPGQEELVEVTFSPQSQGGGGTTIDVKSNATNGTQQVQMSGTALKAKGVDVDPTVTVMTGGTVKNGLIEFSAAGVSGVRDADGYALMQSVPNPGRDVVQIGYELPASGVATLMLYDAQGRAVRTLDAGAREPGSHQIRIDVSGLSAGTYIYRLTVGGHTLSRTLTVVR